MPPKPFSVDVTGGGCRYLRQICSVLVRVKRRVLSGMSIFRISSMKNDRTTPLKTPCFCLEVNILIIGLFRTPELYNGTSGLIPVYPEKTDDPYLIKYLLNID